MASSQQMKASSSSHQRQMRPDEKAEHNCMDLGSDSVQLLLCSKILRTPGKYFKFQRLHVVPLLLFTIKSSLPGAETSFIYMFSSSSFSVSASVPVSQPNLFHRALTHKTPKAGSDGSLLAAPHQLVSRSNCCLHPYKRMFSLTLCHHYRLLLSSRHF